MFSELGIDTEEVLQAAGTKWNFLPLVCFGWQSLHRSRFLLPDPQGRGHWLPPNLILAGRRINNGMGRFVASELVKAMFNRELPVKGSRALALGLTFKENCPDMRNTRVVDVIEEMRAYNVEVDVQDPWANPQEAQVEYGINFIEEPKQGAYEGMLLAVAHDQFRSMGAEGVRALAKVDHVLYDLKYLLSSDASDIRL